MSQLEKVDQIDKTPDSICPACGNPIWDGIGYADTGEYDAEFGHDDECPRARE